MKIALLTKIVNQHSGAKAPIKLADYFVTHGHEVDLYASRWQLDQDTFDYLTKKGIQIKFYFFPRIRVLGNLVAFVHLLFLFRRNYYDLTSAHIHLYPMLAAKLAGAYIIRTFYGSQLSGLTIAKKAGLGSKSNLLTTLKAWLWDSAVKLEERLSFLFSDLTITISKYLQVEMAELYKRSIDFIYLGADTDFFNRLSKPSPEKRPLTILSVSRIVPYKGFDLLIKAYEKVSNKFKDSELVIAGSAVDPDYLNYLNQIKNDQVKIIIKPSDSELLNLYENCSIYASGDLWVPWSLTPLEASFLSKPLLGMRRGAMPEIILPGETGFLAENQQELDTYLLRLLESEELRERLGKKARERVVREFTWEKAGQDYLNLFKKLVKEH